MADDPYGQSTGRLNPSARVTIGKRISDRVYLTFSRSLSSSLNDQVRQTGSRRAPSTMSPMNRGKAKLALCNSGV